MSKLPTFLIEVSHSSELNEQCLLAMVSAYTNGVISNNRITTATAWYEVDSLPSCGWKVMGWTDRVQSELADTLFAELYCLLAGFYKSGIRGRYQGAFTDRYLNHRQFDLAKNCLHQAKRLATDTQAEQLEFRMQRLTKSSEPSEVIGTVKPERKLFSSLKKLFNEKTYQA